MDLPIPVPEIENTGPTIFEFDNEVKYIYVLEDISGTYGFDYLESIWPITVEADPGAQSIVVENIGQTVNASNSSNSCIEVIGESTKAAEKETTKPPMKEKVETMPDSLLSDLENKMKYRIGNITVKAGYFLDIAGEILKMDDCAKNDEPIIPDRSPKPNDQPVFSSNDQPVSSPSNQPASSPNAQGISTEKTFEDVKKFQNQDQEDQETKSSDPMVQNFFKIPSTSAKKRRIRDRESGAFQCRVCQECYQTQVGLKLHLRSHASLNDVKSYHCHICSKEYITLRNLACHVKKVHKSAEISLSELPFHVLCPHCDKPITKSYLSKHIKVFHQKKSVPEISAPKNSEQVSDFGEIMCEL